MADLHVFMELVRSLDSIRRDPNLTVGPVPSAQDALGRVATLLPTLASSAWRRQYYSSIIVGLYSVHERFVRDLVSSSARLFSITYESYEALPDRTKRENLQLTLRELAEKAETSPFEYGDLQSVMMRLNSCFEGVVAINDSALAKNTANFRTGTIQDILGRLHFTMPDPREDENVMAWIDGVLSGIYASPNAAVDDLADRRNDVAHGSDIDVLDIDTLAALADLVYEFDCWLFRRLVADQLVSLVGRSGVEVSVVAHTWQHAETGIRSVARLLDVAEPMITGSRLYVGDKATPCVALQIQSNGEPVPTAIAGGGPYGVDLGVPVRTHMSVKMLRSRWKEAELALVGGLSEKPAIRFSHEDA